LLPQPRVAEARRSRGTYERERARKESEPIRNVRRKLHAFAFDREPARDSSILPGSRGLYQPGSGVRSK
jgi:hypothetical protein